MCPRFGVPPNDAEFTDTLDNSATEDPHWRVDFVMVNEIPFLFAKLTVDLL
jgi:hypothetical protein